VRGRRKDRGKSSGSRESESTEPVASDSPATESASSNVEGDTAVASSPNPQPIAEAEPPGESNDSDAHPDASDAIEDPVDADLGESVKPVVESQVEVSETSDAAEPTESINAVVSTPADPEPPKASKDARATPPVASGQGQAAASNPLPRILAVANQKGGVGKTTTSVNLGAALAELGFRVLVIDLDPQGNATTGLGIDARNFEHSMYDVIMRDSSLEDCVEATSMKNLFVAPATIDLAGAEIELVPAFSRELKLKRAIETVIDDFDFVLIDCPPSLGLITVNALAAADEVLVPIQCEYYALEGLSQLMRNVHLVASNLNQGLEVSTIVLTMYDARTKLSDQVAAEVREHFGAKVCRNIIPRTVRLSEAPSFGQPITAFDPASRGAIAYRELAKEVSGVSS